jgi:hypothetical protein
MTSISEYQVFQAVMCFLGFHKWETDLSQFAGYRYCKCCNKKQGVCLNPDGKWTDI